VIPGRTSFDPTGPRIRGLLFAKWRELKMLLYVTTWLQLKADRRALTTLEYGLVGSVLLATVVVGFKLLANSASSKFGTIGGSL
jgi:hypothetical protein